MLNLAVRNNSSISTLMSIRTSLGVNSSSHMKASVMTTKILNPGVNESISIPVYGGDQLKIYVPSGTYIGALSSTNTTNYSSNCSIIDPFTNSATSVTFSENHHTKEFHVNITN